MWQVAQELGVHIISSMARIPPPPSYLLSPLPLPSLSPSSPSSLSTSTLFSMNKEPAAPNRKGKGRNNKMGELPTTPKNQRKEFRGPQSAASNAFGVVTTPGCTSTTERDVVQVETVTRTTTTLRPHGRSHGAAKGPLTVASPRPPASANPAVFMRQAASPRATARGTASATPQASPSPRAFMLSPRAVPNAHKRFIPPQDYHIFQSRPTGSPARTLTVYHFVPHPRSFMPIATTKEKPYVYLITKGEQVGIYANWTQAAARVSDIPDGIHQKCLGWQEAIELYTEAYNDGAIKVVPLVGGRYDHGIYFEDSEDVSPLEGGWEELHDCIEELTQAWCVSLFF